MAAPKVFGREMEQSSFGDYEAKVGLMRLCVELYTSGKYDPSVCVGEQVVADSTEMFDTVEECIAWLESTARRIMRECFEIAGEMVATETEFCYADGLSDIERRVPVRFKDD